MNIGHPPNSSSSTSKTPINSLRQALTNKLCLDCTPDDVSALTTDSLSNMSGGVSDTTRGDPDTAVQSPPRPGSAYRQASGVSREELAAILQANNATMLEAMQRQMGAVFAGVKNAHPHANVENDTETHATASTTSSTPSRSTTSTSTSRPTPTQTANARPPVNDASDVPDMHRAKAMRQNFLKKHNVATTEDTAPPHHENGPHGIPVGTRCELKSDDDTQTVEFFTYANHVVKADPEAEVTAAAAAEIAKTCLITMDPTLKIDIVRAVERAPIEGPRNKNNAKLHGYFVMKLVSHDSLSMKARGQLLRDTIQQFVTQEFHSLLSEDSDMPKYAGALRYNLAPVNSDEWMPLGLISGLAADTVDDFDVTAKEKLLVSMIEEANICMENEDGTVTNPDFKSIHTVRKNLGVLLYTTSAIVQNGRNSKALAIGYAKNERGEEAAKVFADACEGKSLSVYGGVLVTFTRFPSRGPKNKKTKEDPLRSFVKDHITKNHANCNKYYRTVDIDNVTPKIYDDDLVDNITSTVNHIVGIVPRVVKGTPDHDDHPSKLKATVIIHKIGAMILKGPDYFRRIFLTNYPSLFPASTTATYATATKKKATVTSESTQKPSSKKPTANWEQCMDQNFQQLSSKGSGEYYVILWGKGGRGSVGYTTCWYGPGGAKERTNRVSGAICRKVNSKAEVFASLKQFYDIENDDQLAAFHRTIPHTETNLSPTWPLLFQGMPHRYGAKNYTYVEYDSDDVLDSRIQATIHFTGTQDGVITHRNQLSKPFGSANANPDESSPSKSSEGSDDSDDDNKDQESVQNSEESFDEDDDPAPNSQAFFGREDMSGKKRRLRTPTPSPKSNHFTNSNWVVTCNPSIITTITDLSLHAKDFPMHDKLTAFEFVACIDKWKESDRAIMAVFTQDEATADAYAHWMEHRAKTLFNVPVMTDVLSPVFKASLSKFESNWHEETMATSELTQYVKNALPVKHHADFKRFIPFANKPGDLVEKLITEWRATERIKEVNTKRASPKSAMDFDTPMAEATDATMEEAEDESRIDKNAEDVAQSRFNPITTPYEWDEATEERKAEALYLIAPNYLADQAAKTAASKAAYEAALAAKTAASTAAPTNSNAATTTSNAATTNSNTATTTALPDSDDEASIDLLLDSDTQLLP